MVRMGTLVGVRQVLDERTRRTHRGRGAADTRPKRAAADRVMREEAATLERKLKQLREAEREEEEEEEEDEDGDGDGLGGGPSGPPPPPPPAAGAAAAITAG